MTVTLEENPTADEFFTADDPVDVPPALGGPPPPGPDAPYGWTRDTRNGPWRPKKSPGRPRHTPPPGPDEVAAAPPVADAEDAPPPDGTRRGKAPVTDADVPMPRGGIIAKGVNKLYRRAGKFIRIVDNELGLAFGECTRPDPDDPDAPTVGEAWEALAAGNPRIRAWLLNLIKGGHWQDLAMAHAPIAMALFMRPWVQRLLGRFFPGVSMGRAAEVLLEPDEDTQDGDLTAEDVEEMRDMTQADAERIAARMASGMGVKVPPGVAAAAMRQANAMADRQRAPEATQRTQQPRRTRAKRKAHR